MKLHYDIFSDRTQLDPALKRIREKKFFPHGDLVKNWDTMLAYDKLRETCQEDASILDAGGEEYSQILPWLATEGYTDLNVVNTLFTNIKTQNGVVYRYGNIEGLKYLDESFNAISCLSVLEHGVDLDKFFPEMMRILKPGGHLILSVDYEYDEIDCSGIEAFGVPMKIFSAADIQNMCDLAQSCGFMVPNTLELTATNKPVTWNGKSYGFIYIEMKKFDIA